jgi:hypothetical protein
MWTRRGVSAGIATLLGASSMVAEGAAPPDAVSAATASLCTYRDAHYSFGALICVAPNLRQICESDNKWGLPTSEPACASAQIPVPGALPPAQCIYHDVKYAVGAAICVAPSYAQQCQENGSWLKFPELNTACKNAQIPVPTGGSPSDSTSPTKAPGK